MNPAARYSAAIDILDKILVGEAAEKALTNWARSNRYAGSGDRHAVRDLVYDALRCKRSFAWLGKGETGRGLMLGSLRAAGVSPAVVFTGEGYAPAPLTPEEETQNTPPSELVALDCPDWLAPELRRSLGDEFDAVLRCLQSRAPVFLRVNLRKSTRDQASRLLADDGITTAAVPLADTALEVLENPRKVQTSKAFLQGIVELQDAASQAIVDMLPLSPHATVLDYCAGGGGKSLAMAGRSTARFFAHDAAQNRMKDLPVRAKRAGVRIETLSTNALAQHGPFDLVLADAPCSGSGSWRRAPEAKWALTADRLTELCALQATIMDQASRCVAPGGTFAYATCSLLNVENADQITAFLSRHSGWVLQTQRVLTPLDGGDGFFIAILKRLP